MRAVAAQWSGLLQSSLDSGAPAELPDYADRSVQIEGTLGVAGTVVIEGSNDGSNYVLLTDPQGNALTITAVNRLEQVQEITRYIRPRVTGGDGTTNFTVTLYGRRL
jgi:hypothetical protein